MSAAAAGNRPSTVIVAGTEVNQVGGSMIAVSRLGRGARDGARRATHVVPVDDPAPAVAGPRRSREAGDQSAIVEEAGAVRPGTDVATARREEALQPRADRRVRRSVRRVGAGVPDHVIVRQRVGGSTVDGRRRHEVGREPEVLQRPDVLVERRRSGPGFAACGRSARLPGAAPLVRENQTSLARPIEANRVFVAEPASKIALPAGMTRPLGVVNDVSASLAVRPSSISALRVRTAVGESIARA